MKKIFLFFTLLFHLFSDAQKLKLLKNINSTSPFASSSTILYTAFDTSKVIFISDDGIHGVELWITDGTEAGTTLLKDIEPSLAIGSNPSSFTFFKGKYYFLASTIAHGQEMWVTDGTTNGTKLFKDLLPGPQSGVPTNFTELNGKLYFTAQIVLNSFEMMVTDGTDTGTKMLIDIDGPGHSSTPFNYHKFNNKIYFYASTASTGKELYSTDGTALGTSLIKDINIGTGNSFPSGFIELNNKLLFKANDGINGMELWSTDGTTAGTVLIKDINPGINESYIGGFTFLNGKICFTATDGVNGQELWSTDGTTAGTNMIKDIWPNVAGSVPSFFTPLNGKLYFTADSSVNVKTGIWETDGTNSGTKLIHNLTPFKPLNLKSFKNKIYFTAIDKNLFVDKGIYETNGNPDSLKIITTLKNPKYASNTEITVCNNFLFLDYQLDSAGVEPYILTFPKVSITFETIPVKCFGDSNGVAIIKGTDGLAPYVYKWNNPSFSSKDTLKNLKPGIYKVTVTDSKMDSAEASITIIGPKMPLSIAFNVVSNNVTAIPSGGTAPYSYKWNTVPAILISTATNLLPGTYTVTVTDSNNCKLGKNIAITNNSIQNNEFNGISINIFPIPTNNYFIIKGEFHNYKEVSLKITNLLGEVIEQLHYGNIQIIEEMINVESYQKGRYNLQIMIENRIYNYSILIS